jgi:hypothetical protein
MTRRWTSAAERQKLKRAAPSARQRKGEAMPGKRVQLDEESWRQLDLLAHDQMKDFQELADEAFRDLLKKYGRPVDLKDALRRSAGVSASVHQLKLGGGAKPRRK